MPRPSRVEEAKEVLRRSFALNGGLPSLAAFAQEMGYSSTASAHDVAQALVEEGFLAKGPTGRLLPGRCFEQGVIQVPVELLAVLPAGVATRVLHVPDDSMVDAGIWRGDYLVVMPDSEGIAGLYVLSKAKKLAIGDQAIAGWKVEGRLVAQFRPYR